MGIVVANYSSYPVSSDLGAGSLPRPPRLGAIPAVPRHPIRALALLRTVTGAGAAGGAVAAPLEVSFFLAAALLGISLGCLHGRERRKAKRDAAKRAQAQAGATARARVNQISLGDWKTQGKDPMVYTRARTPDRVAEGLRG